MNYHAINDRLADKPQTIYGAIAAFRLAYLVDDAMTREEYFALVGRLHANVTDDDHINRMRGRLAAIKSLRCPLIDSLVVRAMRTRYLDRNNPLD